ncbi:MAG: hypothetical protein O2854_07605 [Chloroflexi bacterium]|nr:hypothetical protein [Chloroflexota bacterium]
MLKSLQALGAFFTSGLGSPEMLATNGVPVAALFYKLAIAFLLASIPMAAVVLVTRSGWPVYLCLAGSFICTALLFLSRNAVSRETQTRAAPSMEETTLTPAL